MIELLRTARAYQVKVQPQLFLLQKTLFSIEALGRRLDPDLNLWETAKPCLEAWVKRQLGPKAMVRKLQEQWPYWLHATHDLSDCLTRLAATPASKPKQWPMFVAGLVMASIAWGVWWHLHAHHPWPLAMLDGVQMV